MDQQERDSVAESLEWIFCHMGAGDESFAGWEGAVPISGGLVSHQQMGEWMCGYEKNPTASGLKHQWGIRTVFLDENRQLVCFDVNSVHWSRIARRFSIGANLTGHRHSVTTEFWDDFVQCRVGCFSPDGKRTFYRSETMAFRGERMDFLTDPKFLSPKRQSLLLGATTISVGMAVVRPAYWTVKVRAEECVPSLTMFTDAVGVRELLRVREVPEGRMRRAALLHWVSSHWRQNRVDEESEHYVRKHFRGGTKAKWGRFVFDIEPSDVDRQEERRAKLLRSMMRSANSDKRRISEADIRRRDRRKAKVR